MLNAEPILAIGIYSLAEDLKNKLIKDSVLSSAQAGVVEDMLIELLLEND